MYRGHTVTLFNRGRSNTAIFPGVEKLVGDRDGQLDALRGGEWDVVIDNSGYVPRHVRDSTELLKDNVGRYLFISTASVYQFDQADLPEDAALLPLEDPTSEDVGKYYGPLKVVCEETVREVFGSRGTVVRLHVVAGPGDPTNRFTYWPVRVARGGEMLAPGDRDNPVQFIDVRDLAEFNMQLLERNIGGTYNAAGPTLREMGMAQFLAGVRAITSVPISFRWVDDALLRERNVRFPLWYSQNSPARGACRVRSHRGVAVGLRFRPLAVTALDTIEWFESQAQDVRDKLRLNLERDAELLAEIGM
jgi:2'-hydroxyisoflavone reductase